MTSLRIERQFWRSDVTRGKLLQNRSWSISRPYTRFCKKKIDKMCRLQPMENALAIIPDSSIVKTRSWPTSDERGIFHRRYGAKCSICEIHVLFTDFENVICECWHAVIYTHIEKWVIVAIRVRQTGVTSYKPGNVCGTRCLENKCVPKMIWEIYVVKKLSAKITFA